MQHPSENHVLPLDRTAAADRTLADASNGAQPPSPAPAAVAADAPPEYSRPFVLGVIMLTVAVTIIAISLIYFRWLTVSEPVSAIVVEGSEQLAPTKIRLTSSDHPPIEPPDLTAENKYITPVLLHPGSYILTAKQDDRVIMQISFKIEPHRGIYISIPKSIEEAKRRRGVAG